MLFQLFHLAILVGRSLGLQDVRHARCIGRDTSLDAAYDFVIIGGGTSGLTVADRITENPNGRAASVLVIEYGPFDEHEPSVLVPGLLNLSSTPYWFNLTSTPQQHLDNRTFQVPAAAVVGGGTVINGMFFDRGSAADYDAWASLGNPGWAWDDLYPYFKKSEQRTESEDFTPAAQGYGEEFDISWETQIHGHNGPVRSSYPVFQFPVIKQFFQAWHSLNVTTPKDPGGGKKAGVFWAPSSLDPKDETRSYARTAHYDRVIGTRSNYHLITNSAVQRILVNGDKTTGVQFDDRKSNQCYTVHANKEVVLAAGSTHSPQILQLSGIGPKDTLEKLGIKCFVDLPGVGQNFQDHPTIYTAYEFKSHPFPTADTLTSNQTYADEQLALYWSERQGPYTIVTQGGNTVTFLPLPNITSGYQSIIDLAMSQSIPSLYPNIYDGSILAGYEAQRSLILRLYASTSSSVQETGWNSASTIPITLVKPLSRGSVRINTTDVLESPLIDFGTLTNPTDLETLIAILRINRAAVNTPAMQELVPVEVSPGANLTTDSELREALRGLIQPTYSHPCCTCAMMPKELGGVVGPDLKVYGVQGLSVMDASIMPLIPVAHLSSTVYAVAEKAADLIKGRYGLA